MRKPLLLVIYFCARDIAFAITLDLDTDVLVLLLMHMHLRGRLWRDVYDWGWNVNWGWMHMHIRCFHVHDWQADPFARGAYSYVPVGGLKAMRALARPIERTLFVAGEATHWEGMSGTVAGAIASGYRAAREVTRYA